MPKPFCQITIKDLLLLVQEEMLKRDILDPDSEGNLPGHTERHPFSLDEIADLMDHDPDILSATMEKAYHLEKEGKLISHKSSHQTIPVSPKKNRYIS